MAKKFSKSSGKASPQTTNNLNKAVGILSKIGEVAHWVGAVGMLIVMVFGFTNGTFPWYQDNIAREPQTFNTYGFEVTITNGNVVDFPALGWFGLGGIFIMIAMAMVFRNLYLITKNSRNKTPFTVDNMRLIKEIGIFFVAIPVIGLIFDTIIRLATSAECSMNFSALFMGLIMIYLTQIFARGVELEDDTKGLI